MKGHLNIKELEKYKKADLQKLAEELGVSTEEQSKNLRNVAQRLRWRYQTKAS